MSENLLENLNNEQLKAVTYGQKPLMIIAGAGTGKTTAITQRIAWLIEQGKAKPDEILALTFTEKAATEMEERVDRLLPIGYLDLWVSTFHSFCERVLKEHALEIGIPHEFKLMNEVDTLLLLRRNFDRFDLDYYRPRGNPTRFLKALLQHFSRAKDEMISPRQYLEFAENLQSNADTAEGVASENEGERLAEIVRIKEVANAFHVYQQILLENNALDFADLVSYSIELFQKRPNILKKYQKQFKYILVDEFQDTNSAQYELIKLLAQPKNNITMVGDDDQSIYKFRGASLTNILRFHQDFPEAESIVLNKNYRSTSEILDHAYKVIQNNNPHRLEIKEKIDKKLMAQTVQKGTVEYIHCTNLEEEVRTVLEKICNRKKEDNAAWSDFCILVRANDSAEPFTSAMDRAGIPYRFLAMSGLYTKPIIVDALAWMRTISQPHDSPAFYRILSHPVLGVGEQDIAQMTLYCRRKGKSIFAAVKAADIIQSLSPDGYERLRGILADLSDLQQKAKRLPVSELFVEIMKVSGLVGNIRILGEFDQQEQFSLLQQFYQRLKKFESANDDKTLHHFLLEFEYERDAGEIGSLTSDPEAGPDVIKVMTIHAAKGLEFRYVFLVNLIEQRFPTQRRAEAIPFPEGLTDSPSLDAEQHIAEERRLFYVGLTRAKECLFLLSADDYGGARKRRPSRFLLELDLEPIAGEGGRIFYEQQEKKQTPDQKIEYKLPPSVSFTQIAAFTTCPLQYKFAHILKVPVFGRHSLSFGKTMHNTLHRFMGLVMQQQQTPQASLFDDPTTEQELRLPKKEEFLKIYEDCWIDEWYPNEALREEYWEKGKESLLAYYDSIETAVPIVHCLEKSFTLKLGEVTIKGRIDRIDNIEDGVEIIDYKTGRAKSELSWQDKRQLILYQLAAEQCFDPPLKVKKLTYQYLEDNSLLSFEASKKEKEKLRSEILSTVASITSSDFKATPGFHCRYCDFKDICEFSQA
ncbi:UvrD-helicase domain-containing protein [Patescibacteria group bacterium]|nr:UvrD-helicase domain-containing protein [Patescibacteria group bacterium]